MKAEVAPVGEAFRRVARRVSGETDVPELDLSPNSGWWMTFKRWMGLASHREVGA